MAQVHRVGPCFAFMGNPNIASGAGMTFLGFTRGDVTVAPNINISTGRVDQIGMSGLAESAWSGGLDPVASLPLIDEDKDKLEKLIIAGKKQTNSSKESFGFGSGFTKLTAGGINTLALIPYDELTQGTNGVDAPNGVWFPAAIAFDFGNLVYNLPEGTDDAHVVHEVQVRGLRLDFDSRPKTAGGASLTAATRRAIPPEHRVMFIGPPSSIPDAALTIGGVAYTANKISAWSLPATGEI